MSDDFDHHKAIRKALRGALADGGFALKRVPEYALHLIEVQGWLPEFESLRELVEAPVLKGGFHDDVNRLEVLCARTAAEVPLREALGVGQGRRTDLNNNISEVRSRPEGTARAYTLTRLQRQRPDLAKQVTDGELSANAAAIEAGFRKPTATVPIDTVEAAIRALARRFPIQDIAAAVEQAIQIERTV